MTFPQLASLFGLLLVSYMPLASVQAAEHPNVIVILSDDQGWGDLSLNGNTNLQTPRIDSLARDGARFDRFFVCPVCSPTRAEFLTGRYHPRSGVYSTSAGGERMDLDEVTIAETFRAAGYATGAFGKWHNGMQYPYHPNGRGFEEYYGFCSGHWGDYFSPPLEHNGQLVQGNGFCIDDFTDRAIKFMGQAIAAGRPFFAYLPYNTPHSPMQVPDAYWDKFKDAELQLRDLKPASENMGHTRAALAMCENIDWNVGRMLDKLEQWQVGQDTIVVYFCDNGPNGARWNGGMKGRKGSTDEGGVRSPLLIRWPGTIPSARLVRPIGGAIDLLPTLAGLAKVPLISEKPLDGIDLSPWIEAADAELAGRPLPEREIISHWNNKTSVRNQRFRLDHAGELFDLVADPGQQIGVAAQFPEVAKRLRAIAADFRAEIAGYDDDQRAFPLGHETYRFTQIPARDARASGGLQRSNRFPNCSYFTNWTSTEDRLTWDVEVAAEGTYQVDLQYTCPAGDVGSTIQLSLGESQVTTKITQPHDPPLRGAEHDRVPRQESYVKDFATLRMGEIHLKRGPGRLTLSATDIPGSQAMDFRLLLFTKLD